MALQVIAQQVVSIFDRPEWAGYTTSIKVTGGSRGGCADAKAAAG